MRAEEFAARIKGARRTGNTWAGRCPAHEDSDPSLTFSDGNRGVVTKCWAGCTVEAICAAVGLQVSDLFEEPLEGAQRRSNGTSNDRHGVTLAQLARHTGIAESVLRDFGLEDATHKGRKAVAVPYRDGEGATVRTKYRTALDGKPKYLWGDGDDIPPYGTWRLGLARDARALVVTEGESDAWSLWAIGVPALGIDGADRTKILESAHLRGIERLWVCQDSDDGAGANFVKAVTERVDALAPGLKVRVVRPPRPHKDISDWRRACPTLLAFKEAFREACRLALTLAEQEGGGAVVRMSEVRDRVIEFGWRPYIPEKYLTMMGGKPGFGKSNVTCALTAAVTRGIGPLGTQVAGPANVLLLSAEDDISSVIKPRLRIAGADLERVFAFDFEVEDFFLGDEGVRRLDHLCGQYQPKLVILDPIVSFLGGEVDMNRANEVRAALRPVREVAARHNTSILITAHVSKMDAGEAMDAISGSVDFAAVVRSVLIVYRDPEAPPRLNDPRSNYVLAHAKHNLSRPGAALRYQIEPYREDPDLPQLSWVGKSAYTTDQLRRIKPDLLEDIQDAAEFLMAELGDERRKVKEVLDKARGVGITREAMDAAIRRLGVKRVNFGFGTGEWYFVAPAGTFAEVPV